MATKSVIDIEINDAKFKEFSALFEKYQKSLDKMPGQWGNINKNVSSLQGNFNKMQHALDTIAGRLDKNYVALKNTNDVVQKTSRHFDNIQKSAKSVASSVAGTTFNLLKWGAATAAFGLLGAAGGMFGIGSLASSASGLRRQSQEYGITPGQLKAARLNFGRYGDVESLLGGIAGAQTDLSKQWAFGASGLNPNQNAAQLMPQILRKAAEVYKSGSAATAGQRLEVSGLTQFGITVQQARQYASLSKEEIALAEKRYAQDQKTLEIHDATLRRWQDLDVQLGRSKDRIENTFITGLEKLTPALTKLSDAFSTAVSNLLKSPEIGKFLDGLGTKLQDLSKYLVSEEFKDDVADFFTATKNIANALVELADFINEVLPKRGGTPDELPKEGEPAFKPRSMNLNDIRQLWRGTDKKLAGVDPKLAQAIWSAGLAPISGVRTEEQEEALRKEGYQKDGQWYTKEGRLLAAPGKSPHLGGNAVDIDAKQAERISDAELAKYGLWRPYGRKDYNHIELLPDTKKKMQEELDKEKKSNTKDEKHGMLSPSSMGGVPTPWNPTSIALNINTTKIPGLDNNIALLQAGGYYTQMGIG
jgi:methyl-accepting chemotaxis protein